MKTIVIILSAILSIVIAITPAIFTENTCSIVEVEDFDECKVITVETESNLYQFYVDVNADEWNTKTECTVIFNNDRIVQAW
jgi:hypothetical protein